MLIAHTVSPSLCSWLGLSSQHSLFFTPFFLFLTFPNSYLIADSLYLRKTQKRYNLRSNPTQKIQFNKERDERKTEKAEGEKKGRKAQHKSRSESDTERKCNSHELGGEKTYFQK